MGDSSIKKSIICSKVGEGLANYPHAKQVGNMLYLSGMSARQKDNSVRGARRLSSGVVMKDITEQTEAVIEKWDFNYLLDHFCSMKLILEEVGATLHDLVEVTVFLKNISDYDSFNKVKSFKSIISYYFRFITTTLMLAMVQPGLPWQLMHCQVKTC